MGRATKIFYNGQIITLDPNKPRVEAMAVQADRVLAIGSNEEILNLASAGTEKFNLQGQVVIPGFNDSHMHLLNWGQGMVAVDLTNVSALEELIQRGREYLQKNPRQKWILGRGWNEEQFSRKLLPTKADLDKISTYLPIIFTRACGHICVANSKALELAAISATTPNPPGGTIDRDITGEPTGILRENAIELVKQKIPTPNVAELKHFLLTAGQKAAELGLTTVQSNDLQGTATLAARLEAYKQLVAADKLPIRVNLQATMASLKELQTYLEFRAEYENLGPYLTLGPLKLYADGSLGGRTAALSHPYQDEPDTTGMTLYSQEELDELVLTAAKANLQVAVHAIGDLAMDLVITSYERAKKQVPSWQQRPRIVHCQITRPDQLRKMAELGIVADIQPIFVPTDLHFVEARIGKDKAQHSYAWQTMQQLGVKTAGGSDCPVENCNPFWGMHAAITRQDHNNFPKGGWNPKECLSPLAALKLFTTGSAYACQEEDKKGSLTAGKFADFLILPSDPTEIPPEQLLQMQVTATYVGGNKI